MRSRSSQNRGVVLTDFCIGVLLAILYSLSFAEANSASINNDLTWLQRLDLLLTDDLFNLTDIEHNHTKIERSLDDFNTTKIAREFEPYINQTDRSLDDIFNLTRQERDLENNQTQTDRSLEDFFNITKIARDLETYLNQTGRSLDDIFNSTRQERNLENNQTQADRSLDDFNMTREERDEHNHTITSRSISDFFNLTRREQELESIVNQTKTYFGSFFNASRQEKDLENNQTKTDNSLGDILNIIKQERAAEHNHTLTNRTFDDSFNVTKIERDLESNYNQTDRSLDNLFNLTKQERDFESVANYNVTGELENVPANNNYTRSKRSTLSKFFNISRQDYNSKLYRNFNNLNRQERNAECNSTSHDNVHRQRVVDFSSNFNQTQDRSFNTLFNFSRPQPVGNLFKSGFNLTRRERNVENNETAINQSRHYIFNFSSAERDEESNSTEQERDDEPVYRRPYSSNILNKSRSEPPSGSNETHQRTLISFSLFPRPHNFFTHWFNVTKREGDVEDNMTQERTHTTFFNFSRPEPFKSLLNKWFNLTRQEREVENNVTQEREVEYNVTQERAHTSFFNFSRPVTPTKFLKLSRQERDAYLFPQYYDSFYPREKRDEESEGNSTQNRSIHNLFNQTHNNESDENEDPNCELNVNEEDEPQSYNLARQDRDIDLKPTFEFSHYLHSHDFGELQTGTTEVPANPTPAYAAARIFFPRNIFNASTPKSEIDSSEEQTANYYPVRT